MSNALVPSARRASAATITTMAALAVAAATVNAGETQYTVTDLGSLFGSHSHVFDMNDGVVVGLSREDGFYSEPFRWERGVMAALPTFGGFVSESGATDLNDDGVISGYSATPVRHQPPNEGCEVIRAFVFAGDDLIDLGAFFPDGDSVATGLNENMRVVGWAHTPGFGFHAFVWENGEMTDIGTLDDIGSSAAWDVDSAGRVVGQSSTAAGQIHAFLWEDGEMTDIDTFGGQQSEARAMNDQGQVAGMWRNSFADRPRSFIWQDGVMTDLGTLGGDYAEAFDIAPDGAIVGTSTKANGELSGFLWRDGTMIDLASVAPGLPDGFAARAIDDAGRIAGGAWTVGEDGSLKKAYLLTPVRVGDLDESGRVDFADLLLLLGAWGPCPDPPDPCPADLDQSGDVGFGDLVILLGNWG